MLCIMSPIVSLRVPMLRIMSPIVSLRVPMLRIMSPIVSLRVPTLSLHCPYTVPTLSLHCPYTVPTLSLIVSPRNPIVSQGTRFGRSTCPKIKINRFKLLQKKGHDFHHVPNWKLYFSLYNFLQLCHHIHHNNMSLPTKLFAL